MSGETSAAGSPPRGLARMRKPRSPAGATSCGRTASIAASGGASSREPAQEAVDRGLAALDLEQHAALVVEHEARQVELRGQAVHERAEADPLDRPLHPRPDPPHAASTSSRSTWYALACASWIRGMCSERVTITWSASPSAATRPPP